MKTLFLLMLFWLSHASVVCAQVPAWQWAQTAKGTDDDVVVSSAADLYGNIYLTGYYYSSELIFFPDTLHNSSLAGTTDLFLSKINSNGDLVWARNIGGSGSAFVHEVAADDSGNVIVTGSFEGGDIFIGTDTFVTSGQTDIFLAKYDPSGGLLWARTLYGIFSDVSTSVACDSNGRIYLTGNFYSDTLWLDTVFVANPNGGANDADGFVACIDNGGQAVWAKGIHGNNGDFPLSIHFSPPSFLTICGYYASDTLFMDTISFFNYNTNGTADAFVSGYSTAGNLLWAHTIGGTDEDQTVSASLDSGGNLYVAGRFNSDTLHCGIVDLQTTGDYDMFLLKYDPAGNTEWVKKAGGPGDDEVNDMELVHAGNAVYVAGYFGSTVMKFDSDSLTNTGDLDAFIARYDTSGSVQWVTSLGGGPTWEDAWTLTIDYAGNVYVGGFYYSSSLSLGSNLLLNTFSGKSDIYLGRLYSNPVGIPSASVRNAWMSISPNPASDRFFIRTIATNPAQLTITDLTGRMIYSETINQSTELSSSRFSAGTYVVRITSENFSEARKLVVIR